MPSLPQMFSNANAKSYYSRPDGEVYSALNEGGKRVYDAIVKEDANYFRVVDTTSVTIVPNVTTYALPPGCQQFTQIAERLNVADKWRPIAPADSDNDPDYVDAGFNDGLGLTLSSRSGFLYVGPYLTLAAAQTALQAFSFDLSPTPPDTRFVKLIYTAKWVEITATQQVCMLPLDCTPAMQSFAIAELVRSNSDSLATDYETKAEKLLSEQLNVIRLRQVQNPPLIRPYLGGF